MKKIKLEKQKVGMYPGRIFMRNGSFCKLIFPRKNRDNNDFNFIDAYNLIDIIKKYLKK